MNMNSIVCTVKTHWFEWSAFVVSGTDIPNANPEVHIQNVAEKFDQKCNCFKHISCKGNDYHRAHPGGKILTQVPRKIMSLQDIEAVRRVNVKYLNGMHMVLGIRNRILSEYRAWFHRNTSQHLVKSNKPSPILSQNDKKQTNKNIYQNDDTGMSSPNY